MGKNATVQRTVMIMNPFEIFNIKMSVQTDAMLAFLQKKLSSFPYKGFIYMCLGKNYFCIVSVIYNLQSCKLSPMKSGLDNLYQNVLNNAIFH